MKAQKHNNLFLLFLLIFIGQVMSAPMLTCSQNIESSSSTMMMDMDEMSSMQMDCCGDKCDCPDSMCLSYVFITSINQIPSYNSPKPYLWNIQKTFIQEHLVSAIFHPPILS